MKKLILTSLMAAGMVASCAANAGITLPEAGGSFIFVGVSNDMQVIVNTSQHTSPYGYAFGTTAAPWPTDNSYTFKNDDAVGSLMPNANVTQIQEQGITSIDVISKGNDTNYPCYGSTSTQSLHNAKKYVISYSTNGSTNSCVIS